MNTALGGRLNSLFGIRRNMEVLLINVGAEVCFIRNTNLVVAPVTITNTGDAAFYY
jgi:hypothetical protein